MYSYKLFYNGMLLRDSKDLDDLFETKEDATDDARLQMESYKEGWDVDGAWHEYDSMDLFEIEIEEVEEMGVEDG